MSKANLNGSGQFMGMNGATDMSERSEGVGASADNGLPCIPAHTERSGRARCRFADTVLVMLEEGALKETVKSAAERSGCFLFEAEGFFDLISIPAFLAIIDPALIPPSHWQVVCLASLEMADYDSDLKLLLVHPASHEDSLAAHSVAEAPKRWDEESLMQVIERTKPGRKGAQ
jgi:hypothetical protein